MKESEFIIICNINGVCPDDALMDDEVYSFLVEAKNKFRASQTNGAMVELNRLLNSIF